MSRWHSSGAMSERIRGCEHSRASVDELAIAIAQMENGIWQWYGLEGV